MNAASFYLGLPLCSDKKEDLKKINDTLVEAKKSWRTMSYDVIAIMTSKDATATMNWNGSSLRARDQVPAVTYIYPKEGIASWMDNVMVLADAKNVDNAKKFQDFLMDPVNAAGLSAFAHYDNAITGTEQYLPDDMKGAPEITPPAGFKLNFVPACP
jgi:spermidine/putrescine transport system substrate-binding protein